VQKKAGLLRRKGSSQWRGEVSVLSPRHCERSEAIHACQARLILVMPGLAPAATTFFGGRFLLWVRCG
jgi:hypothetical protein